MIRPEDLRLIGLRRTRPGALSHCHRAIARRRRERAVAWCAFLLFIAVVFAVKAFWR